MSGAALPLVVALAPDLFLAVRIESAVQAAGAQPVLVSDGAALWAAIEQWPELVLIDLTATDWQAPVRRAKALPHTRAIPIVAFGSHINTAALAVARAAGCDHAWARSHFVAELPALLQRTLHPPTRWPDGWDAPPPPALCRAAAQFNAGAFWECHETLEALWVAERRPIRDFYQGVLQVGVALHHLQKRNQAGAIKMFRRGLPRLRGLPPVCQGVPVDRLATAARVIHDRAVALGPDLIGELDLADLPYIEILGCAG